jgi:cytochrome c biogenesis protein CcdA
MVLFVLAYFGGVLTIVSPCILPVLPFVFARADRPFVRSGVPMLVGMAVTFAVVATLAAVAGGWAVKANQYGRAAAIMLLAMFGLTLIFPRLADHLAKPFVTLGARLSQSVEHADATLADRLYDQLKRHGVKTWYAPHKKGGQQIHAQINAAIQDYDRVLLVLSANS